MTTRKTVLAAVLMLVSLSAGAQAADDSTRLLSDAYARKAQQLIQRHIPDAEFRLSVSVTPNGVPVPRMPYVPRSAMAAALGEQPASVLRPHVKVIAVEVFLAAQYKQPTKTMIKDLLKAGLELDEAAGDAVVFKPLGIEQPRPKTEVDRDLERAEADLRQLRAELGQIKKERDDLKTELTVNKSDTDRLARELSGKNAAASEAASGQAAAGESLIKRHAGPLGLGLVLLTAVLVLAAAFFLIGRNIREAAGLVSKALETAATTTAEIGARDDAKTPLLLDAATKDETAPGRGATQGSSVPLEALHRRLLALHEELSEAMNPATEALVLGYVTRLLETPETVGMAVLTLELLGKERANELYHRLGSDAQRLVLGFLRDGVYRVPKSELMLEAGEALKTKLMAESFHRARGPSGVKVAERLLVMGEADLAAAAATLDAEVLPRLFFFLEPARIASVLRNLRTKAGDSYGKAISVLTKVADAELQDHLDERLLAALDDQVRKAQEDSQRPYLKFYQDIVEAADDELSEDIIQGLSTTNPRVGGYIREHVITPATLFLLGTEIREEILASLSNKDVAALMFGLQDDPNAAMLAAVSERRRSMVDDELRRLVAQGPRKAQAAYKGVSRLLVKKITEIKGNRPLAELTGSGSPDTQTSAAADAQPRRAA